MKKNLIHVFSLFVLCLLSQNSFADTIVCDQVVPRNARVDKLRQFKILTYKEEAGTPDESVLANISQAVIDPNENEEPKFFDIPGCKAAPIYYNHVVEVGDPKLDVYVSCAGDGDAGYGSALIGLNRQDEKATPMYSAEAYFPEGVWYRDVDVIGAFTIEESEELGPDDIQAWQEKLNISEDTEYKLICVQTAE